MSHRRLQRLAIGSLSVLMLTSAHADAQEPTYSPSPPQWTVDISTNSMSLAPTSAKLAVGVTTAQTALHVVGGNVTSSPGTGSLTIGPTNSLHMQMDINDIRVAGSTNSTFGSLYFQRYGGPIVVHGSQALESRLYVTNSGDLGVATADPVQFAIDRQLISADWPQPPGVIAVDGDIWTDRVRSREVKVLDLIRVGRPSSPTYPGPTWDKWHTDAILQVGGKMTAQSIVVHLNQWADDVFDDDYPLMPLEDLAEFVERERHLPNVPTEAEALNNGLDVAKSNELLLRKIEELTLYTIAQQKKIEELERKIDALAK